MNTLLIILVAYFFVSIVIAGMVKRAPTGYEDESGFHNGDRPIEPMDSKSDSAKR